MASSRRTGTSENLATYGTGKTYTALNTWEAATDNDLVTSTTSEVLECYDTDASFNDRCDINGATTNTTYFRIIRPATGEGHDGTPNNGVFFASTSTANLMNGSDDNTSVQDLILKLTHSSASTFICCVTNNGTANACSYVAICEIDCLNSGSGAVRGFYGVNNTATYVVNTLIVNGEISGIAGVTGGDVWAYNCTVEGCAFGYEAVTANTLNCKNCLETNNSSTAFLGTYDSNSVTNASEDTSAPGTGSRTSQTFTFVDSGSDDYHLSTSDTGALGFGTDLSGDGNFAFDDDIDGDTISDWSIGMDSHVAAAATLGILSYHQRSVYPGLSA